MYRQKYMKRKISADNNRSRKHGQRIKIEIKENRVEEKNEEGKRRERTEPNWQCVLGGKRCRVEEKWDSKSRRKKKARKEKMENENRKDNCNYDENIEVMKTQMKEK